MRKLPVVLLAVFAFLAVVIGCKKHPGGTTPVAATPPPSKATLHDVGLETAWLDTTVDPCTDFYSYACGGFDKTVQIPSDEATWGATEILEKRNEDLLRDILEKSAKDPGSDPVKKKIGDWYQACMDEDSIEKKGIQPIQPLLDIASSVKDFPSLAKAVTELHKRTIWPLFDVTAEQDLKDSTLEIAALDQDGLGLPDRDYYLKDDGNRKEIRDFYRGHVERVFGLAGWKPDASKKATADVMRIETAIAKLSQDRVERRDPYKIYHKVDRAGLKAAAKTFPWDDYFTGLGYPDAKDVTVNSTDYFKGIDALMHTEKPEAWRNYLTWQVLSDSSRRLSKAFVMESFAYRQKLTGQKELEPRWKRCVRSTDAALGELLGQPYVALMFNGDSKKEAESEVQGIRTAMREELSKLPWMDAPTRAPAQEKLDKMVYKIGYPAKWKTYDFEVKRDDYAANALASDAFELQRTLKKIGKPVDREEWQMTAPTVNAYYDPSMNEMVFPAGILQPPFFSKDFAEAVNFGATGGAMGHELTHGFDDEGSQFDASGNLRNWWSEDTAKKFADQTGCVVKQYDGYEPLPGQHLNGKLTLGENIADIGGLKLAYTAYRKARAGKSPIVAESYDEDQIFFLGFAQSWCEKLSPEILEMLTKTDPHSPARFRVDGSIADVPAFGDAFQCKAGTPMRPSNVCEVW
jgi:putative endopeptidase